MQPRLTRRRGTSAAGAVTAGTAAAGLAMAAVLAGCGSSASSSAASSPAASSSAASSAAASAPAASSPAAASSSATAGQHVTITGTSGLRFTPMSMHVHSGQVQITLKDMGSYPHNIVIPGLHVTSQTVTGDPGAGTVSFSVTFPHPGRYLFHCQYHASAGMVGAFLVS